jgi:spore coat polysaccharide biosynthesis protein SpsF (cytidylyltransferase family)
VKALNRCVVVVQARLASKRLPRKVLAKLGDRTMLEQIVRRCKEARTIESVVVACPIGDDVPIFEDTGIACIPGSETDLVERLTNAAKAHEATHFVRVTADCPFVCPRLIEHISWAAMNTEGAHVATNWKKRTFPDGLDLDCWDLEWLLKQDIKDREYFAQEIIMGMDAPAVFSVENPEDLSKKYRLTVDYEEDLEMARLLYKGMGKRVYESQEIISYLEKHPKIRKMNQSRVDGLFGAKQ